MTKKIKDLSDIPHSEEYLKKLKLIEEKMSLESREGDLHRARSVTVGTCFGGTTEVGMRSNNGNFLHCIMQPVEVIELIHQLAANVGCHLHLLPRKDFASWRSWEISEEDLLHFRGDQPLPGVGHAPHLTAESMIKQINMMPQLPEEKDQPGVPIDKKATKKQTVKRPRKRS